MDLDMMQIVLRPMPVLIVVLAAIMQLAAVWQLRRRLVLQQQEGSSR